MVVCLSVLAKGWMDVAAVTLIGYDGQMDPCFSSTVHQGVSQTTYRLKWKAT